MHLTGLVNLSLLWFLLYSPAAGHILAAADDSAAFACHGMLCLLLLP
jgi:hypothetical protein